MALHQTVRDLASTQRTVDELLQLLCGVFAIFRVGEPDTIAMLNQVIRSDVDLLQIAAHVRHAQIADVAVGEAFPLLLRELRIQNSL